MRKIEKTDEEWKRELTPDQYWILRHKGTEPAFSGTYHDEKGDGKYLCAACGEEIFSSETKYDSGTGWPSFYKPVEETKIENRKDSSQDMERTEVVCSKCGGHLGHVFPDGPEPTGRRYCINSGSLQFKKK